MANANNFNIGWIDDNIYIDDKTHAVQSKPIMVSLGESDMRLVGLSDNDIKHKLCQKLADELFKINMIEFTKTINPNDYSTVYRARAVCVTREGVQLIREKNLL